MSTVETDYAECGTYAGWNLHRKDRTRVCGPCKAAQAAYIREFRQRHPEYRAKERRESRARSKALWRLADLHPVQFQAFVDAALAADERTT